MLAYAPRLLPGDSSAGKQESDVHVCLRLKKVQLQMEQINLMHLLRCSLLCFQAHLPAGDEPSCFG